MLPSIKNPSAREVVQGMLLDGRQWQFLSGVMAASSRAEQYLN
jgi:hypothetical protein